MSKLKKAPPGSPQRAVYSDAPISRTLKLAQDVSVSLWPIPRSGSVAEQHNFAPSPTSAAEQYWAARALSAETILSTREVHKRELQDVVRAEEVKRVYEITIIAEQHKERHASLERLVTMLLGLVALLVALVIYLATHYSRQSTIRATPSHFTIPILSPFTSVVEHETSVIGSKTIALILLVVADDLGPLTMRSRSKVRPS
ncbi:hypothetical protein FPV67DRAFT_1086313 [Lyophyllum atratum]|nr:hypothetical protein FPV67DRAFT_1086313 [Lyophyllum atratum]